MAISLTDKGTTEVQERPAPVMVTDKAVREVKRIVEQIQEEARAQNQPVPEKLYLRMRVVGGGCSGFQHKLDLDKEVNPKLDEVMQVNGLDVVIDKRSLMYLHGATVDFHDDLNRRGFSITNPQAKSTCGCGSSFSM
ncbi:MAG TPA: iron-sulfur cluster assembly accessory protein [Gemmataceae bacterium]|nr:iron-sulfur cluster assembly accessory protein [Gemmataceae bacterium]